MAGLLNVLPSSPTEPTRLAPEDLPRATVAGLYVHVPFCFHKCHYCDFYSITRQMPQRMGRFVDLVLGEAAFWGRRAPQLVGDDGIRTVFFGGGTPSLLPVAVMRRLIQGLRDRLDLGGVNEWTVECNPATVDREYLAMLRESGVTRLSFGAQSFDGVELKMLERHHEPDDVAGSIEEARAAGFQRLNVDLIYAIPGQDMASWLRSLSAALALGTTHLSCYGLTYEPNTPMAVKKRLGQVRPVEETLELEMLHATRHRLAEAGMPAYEISNYAVAGEECRHNLVYWSGENYLGLGPSAASHVEGWRWRNRPHLGEWEMAIESGDLPAIDVEHLSPRRRAGELAYLQLRLARGVAFEEFAGRSGYDARADYGEVLERLAGLGLVQADAVGFRLSEKGLAVADAIAAEFLAPSAG
jgi:oxygen-independent coproporphyrinogen-3 oxidase